MTAWIVASTCALVALVVGYLIGRRTAPAPPAERPVDEAPSPSPAPDGSRTALRLIEYMSPAVAVIDSSDRLLLANRTAREIRLVRGDRVVVRRILALSREVLADGEAWCDLVISPQGGGENLTVRAHGFGLGDGLVGVVLIDVTESHRVEAVRRDFVANVSHELKTPVGAITLLGEAIEDAADDQAAVRRFALSMQKESKRLSLLVQELIELSRLQGGEPAPPASVVRIADIVAECADRARTMASSKDIRIQTAGDADLTVVGVERHLVMALTNLLTNAVSYSPDSTTVAVTYRASDQDAEIVVKDQGIGIAPRDLKRVFERFYRVDRARSRQTGGTGLGLAIVKHIANNHGGSISVWSSEGQGSTFTLRIPRTPPVGPYDRSVDHSLVSDTALAEPDDLEPVAGTPPDAAAPRQG
ncbi:cell wall metabolism sensor histidine kinase WalK [Blastococcus sp. Marseille-P5729]|uniref:sensor histidine kinase n=1 Tax=Blastococcus sp. Marseille-P5729 TaxID=2086582 RepID=UPI000D0F458F|nr:ATP-binding protein [Blastococcus sp. Marseille-P5729]